MTIIHNPVLRGFNPDASMLRVGDDYYIATSTFEWFPGVQIHHSRDLINWRVISRPLDQASVLDLRGVPSSGGIWAPALTYDNGIFYLMITTVMARRGVFKDLHNYLLTATDINGPWSEPLYLNSSGFDPFLFHDDDGSKWLLNMKWDFRKGRNRFAGVVMQQYCPDQRKLIGAIKTVATGTSIGVTEGPFLFKREGWYYLLLAEGGTGWNHAATLARSRYIDGPYEYDPDYPLITTVDVQDHPLQKAGHGAIVETQNGEWYLSYICARSLPGRRLSPLGRETGLAKVVWTEDGWLRLASGGKAPALIMEPPDLPLHPFPVLPAVDHFDRDKLSAQFFTLRVPAAEDWLSLTERPGFLRLRGRESLYSWFRQSMVARRLEEFCCEAETCLEFEPEHFNQMAGLTLYYDESDHFYLRMSRDEERGRHVALITTRLGQYDEPNDAYVSVEGWNRCYMKIRIDYERVQFYCSPDGLAWQAVGPVLDLGQLSDEYEGKLGFTGTFVGLCAQDLSGTMKHADFDYFKYVNHEGTSVESLN
ncbi:xylan 1,4-beta-xylosidase [Paenibacillus sp. BK033]|uniref:glycoside hydrolase family 43 protein n=1 Tax=Paenibacillus sp. BK033 TaxID=2512133 RepID=UPI001047B5C7|nr:glycoside hydrolase family 43 protein [Paenibacillus sp. BK033]TCM99741.1 xylan 1,4-beta-xylosidase [Paenibacillus sp. BK033]